MPDQVSATPGSPAQLSADDAKLVSLARGARVRAGAAEGAALLDDIGRSYAAGSVQLRGLVLSAVQAAVAAAVSSGSSTIESAVIVTEARQLSAGDAALLDELGASRVLIVDLDGHPAPPMAS
jgi:hypothetical protein